MTLVQFKKQVVTLLRHFIAPNEADTIGSALTHYLKRITTRENFMIRELHSITQTLQTLSSRLQQQDMMQHVDVLQHDLTTFLHDKLLFPQSGAVQLAMKACGLLTEQLSHHPSRVEMEKIVLNSIHEDIKQHSVKLSTGANLMMNVSINNILRGYLQAIDARLNTLTDAVQEWVLETLTPFTDELDPIMATYETLSHTLQVLITEKITSTKTKYIDILHQQHEKIIPADDPAKNTIKHIQAFLNTSLLELQTTYRNALNKQIDSILESELKKMGKKQTQFFQAIDFDPVKNHIIADALLAFINATQQYCDTYFANFQKEKVLKQQEGLQRTQKLMAIYAMQKETRLHTGLAKSLCTAIHMQSETHFESLLPKCNLHTLQLTVDLLQRSPDKKSQASKSSALVDKLKNQIQILQLPTPDVAKLQRFQTTTLNDSSPHPQPFVELNLLGYKILFLKKTLYSIELIYDPDEVAKQSAAKLPTLPAQPDLALLFAPATKKKQRLIIQNPNGATRAKQIVVYEYVCRDEKLSEHALTDPKQLKSLGSPIDREKLDTLLVSLVDSGYLTAKNMMQIKLHLPAAARKVSAQTAKLKRHG